MRHFKKLRAQMLVVFFVVAPVDARAAEQANMPRKPDVGHDLAQGFIWASSPAEGEQCYVVFRKTFDLTAHPRSAVIHLFADTRYLLWVNGKFIDRGPCRFDPRRPEYDTLDIVAALNLGQNSIAVLVHYYAVGSFREWNQQCARMMEHPPGLTAKVQLKLEDGRQVDLNTDSSWVTNARTRYRPSPGSYSSVPDNVDARLDDGDWTLPGYDDSQWVRAVPIDGSLWGPLHPRSIPLLRQTPLKDVAVIAPKDTTLPASVGAGQILVFDLERTAQAYAILDFDADEGSILELVHASRYDVGVKEPFVSTFTGDHFKDRYTARRGRQRWMTGDTWGGRYLVLTVRSGKVVLHDSKVVDRTYPFTRQGRFRCGDPMLDRIWNTCVNTVEVCSEDAHVDCADRERAQWMADGFMMGWPVSRVALAGPGQGGPHYADGRLLANMLRHVALSQLADGRLQPMRPSQYPPDSKHGVIDDYSCLWVQAVRDLYDTGGDATLLRELWPTVITTMDYFLRRRTERGLVNGMEFVYFNNPLAYQVCEGTTLNSYVYGSLKDAAYLGRIVGDHATSDRFTQAADDLTKAINVHLWDDSVGSYHGAIVDRQKASSSGHAALLALYYGVVPAGRCLQVRDFMNERLEEEKAFPYTYRYFFEVLYQQDTDEADRLVLRTIRRKWEHMTQYDTGTTSEDWNGGSFIHESGAHPAYFLSAYVLGVRVEGPRDARRLVIEPRLGDLQHAEGTVLCEFGPVPVEWKRRENGKRLKFHVEVPDGALATVHIPCLSDTPSLVVDDRNVLEVGVAREADIGRKGRHLILKLGPGKHTGCSW